MKSLIEMLSEVHEIVGKYKLTKPQIEMLKETLRAECEGKRVVILHSRKAGERTLNEAISEVRKAIGMV